MRLHTSGPRRTYLKYLNCPFFFFFLKNKSFDGFSLRFFLTWFYYHKGLRTIISSSSSIVDCLKSHNLIHEKNWKMYWLRWSITFYIWPTYFLENDIHAPCFTIHTILFLFFFIFIHINLLSCLFSIHFFVHSRAK